MNIEEPEIESIPRGLDKKSIHRKIVKIFLKWRALVGKTANVKNCTQTILDEIFKHRMSLIEKEMIRIFFDDEEIRIILQNATDATNEEISEFLRCLSPAFVLGNSKILSSYPEYFSRFILRRPDDSHELLGEIYPHSHMKQDMISYGRCCNKSGVLLIIRHNESLSNAFYGLVNSNRSLEEKKEFFLWLLRDESLAALSPNRKQDILDSIRDNLRRCRDQELKTFIEMNVDEEH